MSTAIHDILRKHSWPRQPRPTGWEPVLARLHGIKAVLFDIYGTLFISGAGSIASASRTYTGRAFREALMSVGLEYLGPQDAGVERLTAVIRSIHAEERRRGREFPEVDMRAVWRQTLAILMGDGTVQRADVSEEQLAQLAVEFEGRTNPVWPMPHVLACCHTLHVHGIRMGLISNAQFYTSELFPAFFDKTAGELGFDPQLEFCSYRFGDAKPGIRMHLAARDRLARWEIMPDETLCVGNDLRKDVISAARVGFRTALFAGDQRSLRWTRCPEEAETVPDLVLTDLAQLPSCVISTRRTRRSNLPWGHAGWGAYASRVQPFG